MGKERDCIEIAPEPRLAELCLLPSDQLEERLDWVNREIAPHATRRIEIPNGVAWDFEATAELRQRLELLASLERECCGPADVEFAVRETGAARLRFEILGAKALEFFPSRATELAGTPRTTGKLRRVARTGAIAAFGSFLVCCILPIGVAAVAGAAVAAPLLMLDNPWVIGAFAVALGIGVWQLEKRPEPLVPKAQPLPDSGCGC